MFRANGPKFELFETDESDVLHIHDYVHPMPKLSTKGIRVKVRQDYKHSIGKLSSQETQEFLWIWEQWLGRLGSNEINAWRPTFDRRRHFSAYLGALMV